MNKDKTIQIAFVFLVLLFLLRFLAYAMPSARLWGVNHLIFLPPWVAIIYAVIGLAVLVGYYSRSMQKAGEIIIGRFNNIFYEHRRRVLNRIILVILCGAVFAVFAMPTHFLGDGYMQINNLGSSQFVIHKWSERGVTYIASMVQSLLGGRSVANARTAFQVVSVAAGMIAMYFMLLIAKEAGDDKFKRFLTATALIGSGVLLLFFGYAESYPLLWPGLTGFFYFGLKYMNSSRGFWLAAFFFVFGTFIHLYMIVFFPALICLALSGEKGRRFYAKFKWPFWILVMAVAVGAFAILYVKIKSNLAVENIFLKAFTGKPVDADYYMFSVSHLLDMVNLSLVLSPILIVLISMVGTGWRRVFDSSNLTFWLLSSLGGLVFLLVIDPQLSMPRDWDLYAPSFLAPTLLLSWCIQPNRLKAISGRAVMFAAMGILLVVPYLAVNLNEPASVRYFKYIIDLDRSKSISSFIVLRSYYENKGDQRAADSLNNLFPIYYPDAAKQRFALEAIRSGDAETAESYLAAVKPNKFAATYHNLLGGVYYLRGRLDMALEESTKALQLEPFKASTHRERAMMFTALKMYDSVMVWLKSGYQLDDSDPFILGGLSWLHYRQKNFDSTVYYAERMAALGRDGVGGNYWLAKVAALRSNRAEFSRYWAAYRRYGEGDLAFNTRLEELQRLADSLGFDDRFR